MTNLERFDKLMDEAGCMTIDNMATINTWDYMGIEDHEFDDDVFSATWNDDGGEFETHITKKGIEEGKFTTDAFVCKDSEGEKTRLMFFSLTNLIGE